MLAPQLESAEMAETTAQTQKQVESIPGLRQIGHAENMDVNSISLLESQAVAGIEHGLQTRM